MEENKIYESYFDSNLDKLEEMSNLNPKYTGLQGYTLWLSSKSGREKHSARIKLSNADGEISVSIWGEPEIKKVKGNIKVSAKDMKMIKKFISINKETLLDHWNGITDSKEFSDSIKKI